MIELFLDSNIDMPEIFHQNIDVVEEAVQGEMADTATTLEILEWIRSNELKNLIEGHIIDIHNVYFYRL